MSGYSLQYEYLYPILEGYFHYWYNVDDLSKLQNVDHVLFERTHPFSGVSILGQALEHNDETTVFMLLSLLFECWIQDGIINEKRRHDLVNAFYCVDLFQEGRTILHAATSVRQPLKPRTKIIQLLLQYGADPNAQDCFLRTPRHFAVYKGNLHIVKLLLENRALLPPRDSDDCEWPMLHDAVKFMRRKIAQLLLEYGLNINGQDRVKGMAPLHVAITTRSFDMVKFLVENGAKVDTPKDNKGWTAVHWATCVGKTNILRYILEHSSPDIVTSNRGWTPLHVAAEKGNKESLELLREHVQSHVGHLLEVRDKHGRTALQVASRAGRHETVQALLDLGANLLVQDTDRKSPLHLVMHSAKSVKVVEKLLKHKCSKKLVNLQDIHGRTALYSILCSYGSETQGELLVRLLVQSGVDIGLQDQHGMTAIHHLSSYSYRKSATRLLDLMLDHHYSISKSGECDVIDIEDKTGMTALHLAARSDNIDLVRGLLNWYPKLDIQNTDGFTPLHLAVAVSNLDIVRVLLEHDADPNIHKHGHMCNNSTPLKMAICNLNMHSAYTDIARLLILHGANSNFQVENNGSTPLHAFLRYDIDRNDMVEFLIMDPIASAAGNINKTDRAAFVNTQEIDGTTALHLAAARYDGISITMRLIEQGASLNIQNRYGITPLFVAVQQNRMGVARVLMEHGADPNIPSKRDGSSPLHLAVLQGNNGMVELLLMQPSINTGLRNKRGHTAFQLAQRSGSRSLYQLFLEHIGRTLVFGKKK